MTSDEAEQIQSLRAACQSALAWVSNMKIVPGGERERLRDKLKRALDDSNPVRIISEQVIARREEVDHECG